MLTNIPLRVYPTAEQARSLACYSGASRWAYNRVIALHRQRTERWKTTGQKQKIIGKYTWFKLIPYWRRLHPWLNDIPVVVLRMAIADAVVSYKNVYRGDAKPPHFRRKGEDETWKSPIAPCLLDGKLVVHRQLFTVRGPLHKLVGVSLRCVRFKQRAGRWQSFVCIEDGKIIPQAATATECIGLDVGIASLVVDSTGRKYANPRHTAVHEQRLARLQKHFARKQCGSKRRVVLRHKIARLHEHIANSRHYVHKILAHRIVHRLRENQALAMEDLRVSNMTRGRLSKSINDVGWSNLRRELKWQCLKHGHSFVAVPAAYTSQTCHKCGERTKLTLASRQWTCGCGADHDRDQNAAINIAQLGLEQLSRMEKASIGTEGSKTKADLFAEASLLKCLVPATGTRNESSDWVISK